MNAAGGAGTTEVMRSTVLRLGSEELLADIAELLDARCTDGMSAALESTTQVDRAFAMTIAVPFDALTRFRVLHILEIDEGGYREAVMELDVRKIFAIDICLATCAFEGVPRPCKRGDRWPLRETQSVGCKLRCPQAYGTSVGLREDDGSGTISNGRAIEESEGACDERTLTHGIRTNCITKLREGITSRIGMVSAADEAQIFPREAIVVHVAAGDQAEDAREREAGGAVFLCVACSHECCSDAAWFDVRHLLCTDDEHGFGAMTFEESTCRVYGDRTRCTRCFYPECWGAVGEEGRGKRSELRLAVYYFPEHIADDDRVDVECGDARIGDRRGHRLFDKIMEGFFPPLSKSRLAGSDEEDVCVHAGPR